MQLADLRADMQVHADNVQMIERLDPLGMLEHLLVGDAELAVGLARVDAMVRAGIDIGVDTQRDIRRAAGLGGEGVHHFQLLDRFAVDRHDPLLDGVAQLLVAFAHTGIDDSFGGETRLDGLAQLVARGAVDTQPVLADDRKQVVVVVGLDGVVDLVAEFARLGDDTLEGLAQKGRIVEIKRGLESPEFGCDVSAQHNL